MRKAARYRACQCPIMAEGRLHGKRIRKSLDIASWEGAQAIVREWEALGGVTGEAVTIEDAVKRYLADCEARGGPLPVIQGLGLAATFRKFPAASFLEPAGAHVRSYG